jgi:hypothetical protein
LEDTPVTNLTTPIEMEHGNQEDTISFFLFQTRRYLHRMMKDIQFMYIQDMDPLSEEDMTFIYQIIVIQITLVILLCKIPMEKEKVHNLKSLLRVTISL